jgi:hypothetical protein
VEDSAYSSAVDVRICGNPQDFLTPRESSIVQSSLNLFWRHTKRILVDFVQRSSSRAGPSAMAGDLQNPLESSPAVIDRIHLDFRGLVLSRLFWRYCKTPVALDIVKWQHLDSIAHIGTYALGAIGQPLSSRVGEAINNRYSGIRVFRLQSRCIGKYYKQ